jgi:hypothetical protein
MSAIALFVFWVAVYAILTPHYLWLDGRSVLNSETRILKITATLAPSCRSAVPSALLAVHVSSYTKRLHKVFFIYQAHRFSFLCCPFRLGNNRSPTLDSFHNTVTLFLLSRFSTLQVLQQRSFGSPFCMTAPLQRLDPMIPVTTPSVMTYPVFAIGTDDDVWLCRRQVMYLTHNRINAAHFRTPFSRIPFSSCFQ